MNKSAYERLGVSATKDDIHRAIESQDAGLYPGAFCKLGPDVLGGDPLWCGAAHADDAGTKALVAYLAYREHKDASVFRGIAQDALVMNLDDLACVGAVDRFMLCNTINRNRFLVGSDAIAAVIDGYADCIRRWAPLGIAIEATGGETADMNDIVRTILVGATLTTRLRRADVVDNDRIQAGDLIVGLSSTGKATYEDRPNSGIGDNGLTLARHALLHRDYARRFPESLAPEVDPEAAYQGPYRLSDPIEECGMSVQEALLSPTRTYVPILKEVLHRLGRDVHGLVHNTGGGLTKCRRFGKGIRYVKDNLFPIPPLFDVMARHGQVEPREMHQTFNMGHRMEVFVPPGSERVVIEASTRFGVDAQVVGRCEASESNKVVLDTLAGTFEYP